ncbi:MAG: ABC transporter permease subunit [Rhodospirillales bacterium]|nr:ABC transporter permease subunit [Rhodospirillales bacterium]
MTRRLSFPLAAALGLGYAFLYLPILLLIVFSFNESRLVTVWTGFSTRWYIELAGNARILDAAGLSLVVAALSASIALILGTLAAYALTRFGRFRFRLLFAGLLAAPLVMPEVITGLSLLLLFVLLEQAIGWPAERGVATIVIAHATFATAYIAVVVQARLAGLDRSIEEAALDLGARPWKVFVWITLPRLAPGLAAGWLLAFTLSLDDLVVASFVSGPGATTLPMVIFSSVRLGLSPQINALATIVIVVVFTAVVLAGALLTRRDISKI